LLEKTDERDIIGMTGRNDCLFLSLLSVRFEDDSTHKTGNDGGRREREKHDRESFKTHMKSSSMKRACGKHTHRRKKRERVEG
jgi:hypothetical protein